MQKVVYYCDACQQEIGPKRHLSLSFGGPFSGVSIPPGDHENPTDRWIMAQKLNGKFMHFCGGACIARFFNALVKTAKITV